MQPGYLEKSAASNPANWMLAYETTQDAALADLFVLTYDLSFYYQAQKLDEVRSLIEKAKNAGKPVWVFTGGDQGITYADTYVSLLRMGGMASRNPGNQYVMPPFIPDPVCDLPDGTWQPAPYDPKPVLGFCGHADSSVSRQIVDAWRAVKTRFSMAAGKHPFDAQGLHSPPVMRAGVLKRLERENNLTTVFIKHKKYKGGVRKGEEELAARLSYLLNIFQTAYTVCMRGAGNYSVRFYDALALGRIPLLVDTDCMLPLLGLINWQKHCFIHPFHRRRTLADDLLTFHHRFTGDSFIQWQAENRSLWKNYLCYEGFFAHFHLLPPNRGFADRLSLAPMP